jgi:transcriptional adapter 3
VYPGNVYFGVFSERLVAALVAAEVIDPMELDDQDDDQTLPETEHAETVGKDMGAFEERVKMELRYLGILGEDEGVVRERMEVSGRDDEICRDLMRVQEELRGVVRVNNERKAKVAEVAKKWMALYVFED